MGKYTKKHKERMAKIKSSVKASKAAAKSSTMKVRKSGKLVDRPKPKSRGG